MLQPSARFIYECIFCSISLEYFLINTAVTLYIFKWYLVVTCTKLYLNVISWIYFLIKVSYPRAPKIFLDLKYFVYNSNINWVQLHYNESARFRIGHYVKILLSSSVSKKSLTSEDDIQDASCLQDDCISMRLIHI